MSTLFLIWSVHAIVGCALVAPILYCGRKRIGWANWELLAVILPFLVWVFLTLSPLSAGGKSMANLGEPIYISFAMPVLALVRVAVGRRLSERVHAATSIAVLCIVAIAVFFVVPFKPE